MRIHFGWRNVFWAPAGCQAMLCILTERLVRPDLNFLSHIISWEKKIKLVHDTWLVKEWPKNIAHTQFYIIVEFASERPNDTHAFSVLDTPKFMKLAYSMFLREFVEMFYCFLRFFAFIFVPIPQWTFMKKFQISVHVLERMKPFLQCLYSIPETWLEKYF